MAQVQMPDGAIVEMPDQLDPALAARLRAMQTAKSAPQALPADANIADTVPIADSTDVMLNGQRYTVPQPAQSSEGPSLWDRVKNADTGDPIIDMWLHGLPKLVKGAPETALGVGANTLVAAGAGLASPLEPEGFVENFTQQHAYRPYGESAQELTAGLGDIFAPIEHAKAGLGDAVMDATDSPVAATAARTLPDLGMMLFGGAPLAKGAERMPTKFEAPAPVTGLEKAPPPAINPTVESLRAADFRMRPSDVRGVQPDKSVKVPGEFREKFANAADLKKDTTLHNQNRGTQLAAEEISTRDLSEASYESAKKPHIAKYELAESVIGGLPEVSEKFASAVRAARDEVKLELPRGQAPTVTKIMGTLRRRANKRINSGNPETETAGFKDRALAEDLEEAFGEELARAGEPQVLDEFRAARQSLAKIHDAETATRAGQIDAAKLFQLEQKQPGRLSGRLKLIADAHEFVPNVTGHSTKTAARAGGEIESSKEGMLKSGAKALIRRIPGMDVGAPAFQEKFGRVDPARTSYYGQKPDVPAAREPAQAELGLGEALDLEAPPGAVGAPQRSLRDLGPQVDALGNAFEFEAPPGAVAIPPPGQLSLQSLLDIGEPLVMKPSPGRVGKPKRKS